jgi:hypothetical protein
VPAKVIALNRCGLMHTWSYSHNPTPQNITLPNTSNSQVCFNNIFLICKALGAVF